MGARVVSVPPERVAAVRGFNRFYTNAIGALREGLLDSPYSLTEARLIFELAQVERKDADRPARYRPGIAYADLRGWESYPVVLT